MMNPTPRDSPQLALVDPELASLARLSRRHSRVLQRKAGPFSLWVWVVIAAGGVFLNHRSRNSSASPGAGSPPKVSLPDPALATQPPDEPTNDVGSDQPTGELLGEPELSHGDPDEEFPEPDEYVSHPASSRIGTYNGSSTGSGFAVSPSSTALVLQAGAPTAPVIIHLQPSRTTRSTVDGPTVAAAKTQPAAEHRKGKRRTPLLLLVAASLALNGLFIWRAQSHVLRPSFVPIGQANSDSGSNSATASVQSSTTVAVTPAAPRRLRSGIEAGGQTLAQLRPSVKRAGERPVSPIHVAANRAGQRLRWNAVKGATYYNLVLWRDGKRVLDLWPTSSQAVLPSTWSYRGIRDRLLPGRYLWFVYPGIGAKASRHYGALAGSGVLVVGQLKGGK